MTHWYNIYIYIYWITFTHTRTHNYIHLYNAGPVGFCGSVGWFRSAAAMPPMPPMPPQSQSQAEAADLEVSPGMHEMFKSRWRCSFFLLHEFPAVSEFPNGVVFAIPKFKCYWIHVISLSFSTSKRLYNTYLYILSGGCIHISWCLEIFKSAGLMQPM